MQIFEEVLFFKLRTTEKQKNKQLIQLILCQLEMGGWQKEKGTRLTDVITKRAWRNWYDVSDVSGPLTSFFPQAIQIWNSLTSAAEAPSPVYYLRGNWIVFLSILVFL